MGRQTDESGSGLRALYLGQQFLKQGKPQQAVELLQKALEEPECKTVDTHLVLAEALWQAAGSKGTDEALPHYEAAAVLATEAGDASKQGMVALGHGFALSQLGKKQAAREQLGEARRLAEADGNMNAVRFVDQLLGQLGEEAKPAVDGAEAIRATWRQFATAVAAEKPAIVFLQGTMAKSLGEETQRGVSKLRAAGCTGLEVVDVCNPGDGFPDGLHSVADTGHLSFPQLYISGKEVESWLDLEPEALRELLSEAGAPLGEPNAAEPCHGTGAFAEGLEPWEVALVELVSQKGAGDFEKLAEVLCEKGFGDALKSEECGSRAEAVELAWQRLAPLVRDKLETQPEMPCGHSCSTCPTRHDCQLHDAVGDGKGIKDIEDL